MIRKAKDAGFTLVELLSVLVIIGLMTSAVVLTIPRSEPAIRSQTDAIILQMERSAQISLLSGRPQAWGLSKTEYAFFDFIEGQWRTVTVSDWPDSLRVELIREDNPLRLGEEVVPLIIFEPTGLSTRFELRLDDGARREILSSRGDGHVERATPS